MLKRAMGWKIKWTFLIATIGLTITVGVIRLRTSHPPAREFLVYYANETQSDALRSQHYQNLFKALELAKHSSVRNAIEHDARVFPKIVESETRIIIESARIKKISAAIFTNKLALQNQYVHYSAETDKLETRKLAIALTDMPKLLRQSPLSSVDSFRTALAQVSALPDAHNTNIVLIAKSHGDKFNALMPRVLADVRSEDIGVVAQELGNRLRNSSSRPRWQVSKGTTKNQFWHTIGESGLTFSLVIREACVSGISSLTEALMIPSSVSRVAHSGQRNLSFYQIDYRHLFSNPYEGSHLSKRLESRLRSQGLIVEERLYIGGAKLADALAKITPFILFLPMIVWVIWYYSGWISIRIKRPIW